MNDTPQLSAQLMLFTLPSNEFNLKLKQPLYFSVHPNEWFSTATRTSVEYEKHKDESFVCQIVVKHHYLGRVYANTDFELAKKISDHLISCWRTQNHNPGFTSFSRAIQAAFEVEDEKE